MIPPQSTKTRIPMQGYQHDFFFPPDFLTFDIVPIQIGDIGGLYFCFCFVALSGLPLLAASCLAYLSFALRCWGVWACASSELRSGRQGIAEYSYHVQLAGLSLRQTWKCRRVVARVWNSLKGYTVVSSTVVVNVGWWWCKRVWKSKGGWVERLGLSPHQLSFFMFSNLPKIEFAQRLLTASPGLFSSESWILTNQRPISELPISESLV